jgi:transcriptional regulator with XRE-family HTH domain
MNRLRVVRAEKRISQFRLRLETGVNQTKISFIENDLVEATADEKKALAKALKVGVEEIFPEVQDNANTPEK